MKPISPHDPRDDVLDDLIAAALHGELTPEERTQFESRLSNDPAAQAAYQEAQAMHDLLEKNYQTAQPDPAFEQRMVSGVRRKLQHEEHRETAWESALFFWEWTRGLFYSKWTIWHYAAVSSLGVVVLGLSFAFYHDVGIIRTLGANGISNPSPNPESHLFLPPSLFVSALRREDITQKRIARSDYVDENKIADFKRKSIGTRTNESSFDSDSLADARNGFQGRIGIDYGTPIASTAPPTGTNLKMPSNGPMSKLAPSEAPPVASVTLTPTTPAAPANNTATAWNADQQQPRAGEKKASDQQLAQFDAEENNFNGQAVKIAEAAQDKTKSVDASNQPAAPTVTTRNGMVQNTDIVQEFPSPGSTNATPAPDTRKLIRNAQLDLEVKSFQSAMDQIAALTKGAGGYVDTSNSQKGGNGKLQGTVVVKVLPQNLDAFLLKLRDLGQVNNQSVSTDDVTKDYFDTQARLDNSRRMEEQLQDLLKHANSKVADLLQVERELGRVRGDIEQMQGQLKLYDFEVQYATVTMQMREKDMNQAAAYLLKEQDDFSLFATDVEGTFQKARQAADDFKAQVLVANLVHNSGSDVAAELTVMVAPDQIESFLAQVRGLGRVANFTRQTQRVAKDGGDSDQPADQTLTEKDKVQVHLAIRSDDETRKQVALTVVAKAVDDALDQAKTAALANAGVEILSSSLNKTPQGQSTAQLTLRVPGKDYSTLIAAMEALGRTASLSIQRNDNSGPGANGDDAPVIISLALTDDDAPLQETEMSVIASDVDNQAQQIKKSAAAAGVEVKASSFERQPDGTELAQMTFRLPMSKYAAFIESVKALGKVESLTVRRDDRPDQTVVDDTAPAEITLQLHNQRDIVADNNGLWATMRQTFGDGAAALFGSVRVIGVVVAFLVPWVFTLVLLAWVGRRIYIWRKK